MLCMLKQMLLTEYMLHVKHVSRLFLLCNQCFTGILLSKWSPGACYDFDAFSAHLLEEFLLQLILYF